MAFENAPPSAELVYTVHLEPSVAGLRLVADSLEFLDQSGTPRLRVARPSILSSDGTEHHAHLDVSGCQVDRDAAAPWGRPVVAAGASECTVRVSWDAESVTFPALVDPSWVTTANMIEARSLHTADMLASGRVLVVGGAGTSAVRQTAELYDPATRTWAATGSMVGPRSTHTSHILADGRVLVAGGSNGTSGLATSETYSAATGTWTQVGSLPAARSSHMGTLTGGRVLVAGGVVPGSTTLLSTVNLFDPQTNTWSSPASMSTPHLGARAITLTDGRVLVAGGRSTSLADGCVATAEIFNPSTGSWSATGSMAAPRCDYAGRGLPDGTAIVASGFANAGTLVPVDTVEIFNPASGIWRTSTGKVPVPSRGASTALLPAGSMLLGGGFGATANPLSGVSLYALEKSSLWHDLPRLPEARVAHTMTPIGTSDVLVAGGRDGAGLSSNRADTLPLGPQERADAARNSLPRLKMDWQTPNMVRPASSASFGVTFRNDTGGPVSGKLTVVAWTPDGRRVERDVRTISIPPCRTVTGAPCPILPSAAETTSDDETAATMLAPEDWVEMLSLSSIPVQPVGREGVFHVEFNTTTNTGFGLATSNIFYQFTAGYSAVQFNGERGAEGLLAPQQYATPAAYFAALTPFMDGLGPVQGRLFTSSNTWADIRIGLPHADDFEVGGSIPFTGPFNPNLPEFGPRENLFSYFYPVKELEPEFRPALVSRKVCASFIPDFRDNYSFVPPAPASYAKASLILGGGILTGWRPIWTGRLDADGCTGDVNLKEGKYTLIVSGDMESEDGRWFTINQEFIGPGQAPNLAVWAVSLIAHTAPTTPFSLTNVYIPVGRAGNVGMVASRLLRMGADAPPSGTYNTIIYSLATGCEWGEKKILVGAGLFANGLRLCPNANATAGDHNALYKYVIGHEFGHYVESKGGEIPWLTKGLGEKTAYDHKDAPEIPALCRCDGFVPAANALHCLQSQEAYGPASKEGFGHFYATRIWNSPTATAPRFQYYKEFMEPSGAIVPAGGKIVNVRQPPVRWSDTHCANTSAGRGTEYDFLGFYWAIHTAAVTERTTLPEFHTVMTTLVKTIGTNHDGSWASYTAAASTVFGPQSPKFIQFRDKGPEFGVDH